VVIESWPVGLLECFWVTSGGGLLESLDVDWLGRGFVVYKRSIVYVSPDGQQP
jgi:hypothetical protein